MPIPAAVGKGDDADAGFDQAPGGEEVVVEQRPRVAVAGRLVRPAAIAVADARVFLLQIEGIGQLA